MNIFTERNERAALKKRKVAQPSAFCAIERLLSKRTRTVPATATANKKMAGIKPKRIEKVRSNAFGSHSGMMLAALRCQGLPCRFICSPYPSARYVRNHHSLAWINRLADAGQQQECSHSAADLFKHHVWPASTGQQPAEAPRLRCFPRHASNCRCAHHAAHPSICRRGICTGSCPSSQDSDTGSPPGCGLGRAAHLSAARAARPWGWPTVSLAPRSSW